MKIGKKSKKGQWKMIVILLVVIAFIIIGLLVIGRTMMNVFRE